MWRSFRGILAIFPRIPLLIPEEASSEPFASVPILGRHIGCCQKSHRARNNLSLKPDQICGHDILHTPDSGQARFALRCQSYPEWSGGGNSLNRTRSAAKSPDTLSPLRVPHSFQARPALQECRQQSALSQIHHKAYRH